MDEASFVCPSCSKANPSDMRFCGYCGSALPLLCPSCGQAVPVEMSFCGYCGVPLTGPVPSVSEASRPPAPVTSTIPAVPAPARAPPQEERRLVTALFCDLAGFTPLSEQLDPEEVRDIQAEYFSAMAEQIERYGGAVEKYAGDAVLALFGAPIAHEDDAERAVLCALGMQRAIDPAAATALTRWQVESAIRVGVNTGEVISGTWSASGQQDVAVTGDAVNSAARIQAAAEPGEVLVGAETMRLTRRRIQYGAQRDLVVKGKSATVPVWPALRLREEPRERWQEREYVAPLVGRERELAQVLDAWTRAQRGEGQLIMLVGEPGVGKSRLATEVVDMVSSSSTTRVVRARSLSYGQQVSLWLLADLLRSLLGIHEADGQDEVRARLRMAIPTILKEAESEAQGEALDVLGEVLGLPAGGSLVGQAGPEIRRHALIRSLRTLLGAMAERGPLVLLLEDLHWIDSASQDVLRELLVDVPGLRILVLVTARQGWTAPWSDWGWPERLTLRPLEEADAAALAGAVLGGMQLAPEVLQYVAERAAGNPFFLEELLHALDETGGLVQQGGAMHLVPGAANRLPSALTEVVLARLDRLEAQVKQVAQVGSVIGRSFAVRLLARVMKREQTALELPLTALQEAEIAFPRRNPDLEYTFKHVTMREVAYNTLVTQRRKELHLQTARAIAALYSSEEYVELIAYHYARTDEPEAVEWLERAGDRAASIYANLAALTYYQEAMKRLPGDARDIARLQEKMGEVLHHAGRDEEAITVLQQAADGYRAALDLEAAGRVTALLGRVHRFWGTPAQGIALVEPMVEELQHTGPTPALASLHVALAHLYFLVGRYREMLAAAEHGAEIARAVGDRRVLGEAEMRRGTALQMLGQVDDGRRVLELALPLVEAGGDLNCLFITLNNLGSACYRLGRLHQERRYMEQSLAVTERMGNPHRVCFALGGLGSTLVLLGEWQDARDLLERGVELGKTLARTSDVNNPITYLGLLALWEGNWDKASHLLDMALSIAGETENRQQSESVQGYLAELDVLQGRPEHAVARLEPLVEEEDAALGFLLPPLALAYLSIDEEQYLQHAERTTERALSDLRGQPGVLVRVLSVKGMLLIRRGQLDEAEQVLNEGLELARWMPNPYEEGRTLAHLGTARQERGEHERARECLEEALAIFRRLGARKDIERMEEALAGLAGA